MKKGEVLCGRIDRVEFPNKGIFLPDDSEGEVIVKFAVPGQRVAVRPLKKKKGVWHGQILEVIEKAKCEEDAPCPEFGLCGGCTYQSMPYKEQLKLKAGQVKALMDEAIDGDYVFEGILESPITEGYRNKVEFTFGDAYKDGPLTLGFHKRASHYDIIEGGSCTIVDGDIRQIQKAVQDFFVATGDSYYRIMPRKGFLRHLLVRKSFRREEILVDLVTTSQGAIDEEAFKEAILSLNLTGKVKGILHTTNDALADVIKDEGTKILYGEDFFMEEILGLQFKITPFSFFQTNSLGAEVLYSKVRDYVGDTKDKTLFDLYSGTGTIAQIVAPVAKKVVGVEIVPEAVASARENARLNNLANCTFHAGDVLKVIDDLQEVPDTIILDPPRDGIHPKALPKIAAFGVNRIVYISCKVTSLARDIKVLEARGYKVKKVAAVDMFPHTYHVETVVLMSRVEG